MSFRVVRPLALAVLLVGSGCSQTPPNRPAIRSCESVIRFVPEQPTSAVSVVGEWNGFNPERMELSTTGVYELKRTLPARDYGYRLVLGAAPSITDPVNAFRRWVGEVEYSRLRVPDCASPAIEVTRFSA